MLDLAQAEGFALMDAAQPLTPLITDAENGLEQQILSHLPLARTRKAIATLLSQRHAWVQIGTPTPEMRSQILDDSSLYWLLHPPRIAIIGVPNAGKSTLANAMFGQDRSIVADVPGTTRDYIEEYANLGGLPVQLVDTPGLRPAVDGIEAAAIGVSLSEIAAADLRILLLDPTQPRESQDVLAARYPDALEVSARRISPLPSRPWSSATHREQA